ncbi:MAG: hypothetical protein ACREOZ_05070, partial [Gloeomargaritales cyanobacterium]
TWFVEDITLASTTLRFAATNEVSTINNASIANSRIFNGTRSPRALVGVNILFNVDTTFEDVQKFRSHIEQYIKERSRQWVALVFFRSQNIDLSKGAVEYMVKLQHRKSWQEEAIICQSRADLMNCCDAFAEKLGIRFTPGPGSMEVQLKEPQRDLQPEVIDNGSTRGCHLDNSFARPDNTPRRSVSGNQTMLNGSLGIATAQKP